MSPETTNGGPPAGPATVKQIYTATKQHDHGQPSASHRHEQGRDVDLWGWSTCPGCGYLWHPDVVTLDGARARRRLRRAS
jgi:hypothetical protein